VPSAATRHHRPTKTCRPPRPTWGANPAVAHPVLYDWIAESADGDRSQLLVVDPVESETARDADVHVQPEPGTDLALVRAVLAHLVESESIDREFVEQYTNGFEGLVESLPALETAAETVGVSTDRIAELADAVGQQTLLYWGMGVNQSVQGTATARALIDLCLATGNLGPGSGPFSLTGQANSMGNRVCASKETWPGHQEFTDTEARKRVAAAWGVPFSRLPERQGAGFVRIADKIARGEIDVCWTVATNPVAGMPDASYIEDVLSDVFLVVQDAFRSATVECADVVLPAATWGESVGTTINMERRVSRISAATDPPGKVRQDLDIIAAVGNRIDSGLFESPPIDPETVFDELRAVTEDTPADLSGISYDRLADELAVRWPAPDVATEGGYLYHSDDGWSFDTDSGLAEFSAATNSRVPEPTDGSYPLTLTTGRLPDRYNTGVRSRQSADSATPTARMNPKSVAGALESFDRGRTVIQSRRGSVTVDVETDEAVPADMIWLPVHGAAINDLTLPMIDPKSDEPNLKQCAVSVRAPDGS
jgi:assimilatory nitrate reductase catalytic subunit